MFKSLLLRDPGLDELFTDAVQKISMDKFEVNFRRCLHVFSQHLRVEAVSSTTLVNAARFAGLFSRSTASSIRQILEAKQASTPTIDREKDVFQEDVPKEPNNAGAADSENDMSDEDLDATEDTDLEVLSDLEITLLSTRSFQLLRENLSLFLNPNSVKRALFDSWPVNYEIDMPLRINYDINWELPEYLRKYFPQGQSLGHLLTVTGGARNAQAQSCHDCLFEMASDLGLLLLEGVEEFVRLSKNGKSCA